MKKSLLAALLTFLLCIGSLPAAVISFESASDLDLFNQFNQNGDSVNFWYYSESAGFNNSGGIVGIVSPTPGWANPGWAILKEPLADRHSVSATIMFKLGTPAVTVNGYALLLGLAPSSDFIPKTGTADAATNFLSSIFFLRYNADTGTYSFQTAAFYSVEGTPDGNSRSSILELEYDKWYALGLDVTLDNEGKYTLKSSLYTVAGDGSLALVPNAVATRTFQLPGLANAENNYLFFGVPGQAQNRGILVLDNLDYPSIPEAGSMSLLGLGAVALSGLLRRRS